jgi:hypothetical protein
MNYVEPAFVGEMKRTRDMLDRSGSTQRVREPKVQRAVHAEDMRPTEPEPMGRAIKRRMVKRGK